MTINHEPAGSVIFKIEIKTVSVAVPLFGKIVILLFTAIHRYSLIWVTRDNIVHAKYNITKKEIWIAGQKYNMQNIHRQPQYMAELIRAPPWSCCPFLQHLRQLLSIMIIIILILMMVTMMMVPKMRLIMFWNHLHNNEHPINYHSDCLSMIIIAIKVEKKIF